jgi:hypothetical protein
MMPANRGATTTTTLDAEALARWKSIVAEEKTKIKEVQRKLEQDRNMWKLDATDLVSRPYCSGAKKAELTSVKRVLDARARRLNEQIKEMRNVENWIKSKENPSDVPEFDFEEDVFASKSGPPIDDNPDEEDILFKWKSGRDVDSSFDISGIHTPTAVPYK